MKSVEKCKRYSAFYPEKQELPHSLACVYWPVITSPRWRRVGTSQQRSEADNGASMSMVFGAFQTTRHYAGAFEQNKTTPTGCNLNVSVTLLYRAKLHVLG